MAAGRRTPTALLLLASAALLCSWNPLSAPAGLALGAVGVVLCALERRRLGAWRRSTAVALGLSAAGVAASVAVLALLAGVGKAPAGEPIFPEPPAAERARTLDRAAEATRPAREAARRELESVERRR